MPAPGTRRRREILVRGILLLGALGVLELTVRAATVRHGHVERFLDRPWYYLIPLGVPEQMPSIRREAGSYRRYDPKLGWTLNEAGSDEPLYYADAQGIRCSRETFEDGGMGTRSQPDVVALGDSFTHGDEVAFEDAWPQILERRTGASVVNLAVGGYGIDQAILRYEYSPIRAPLVLLGLIPGDLNRARTQIYGLTSGGLKSKPFFHFEGDDFQIVNQPASFGAQLRREFELGSESDFFSREVLHDSRLFQRRWIDKLYLMRLPRSILYSSAKRRPPIFMTPGPWLDQSIEILRYGKERVESRGGRLVVVLLEDGGTFPLRAEHPDPWKVFKERLSSAGIEYFGPSETLYHWFREDPASVINSQGVHYTPAANAEIASSLVSLVKEFFDDSL